MLVHLQVVVAVIVVVGLVVAPADKPHVAPWFVLGATLSYLGVCAAHAIADCRERRSAP